MADQEENGMKKERDKVPTNQADEDTLAQLTDVLRSSNERAERALDEAVMKTEKHVRRYSG